MFAGDGVQKTLRESELDVAPELNINGGARDVLFQGQRLPVIRTVVSLDNKSVVVDRFAVQLDN